MECVTNTRQKSALPTFTLFASVLTQIFLSAFVGVLSAENTERQKNEIQSRSNCRT
jgi:hypothetical protein